jgi:REP element-mobilizing transposase RayT
MSRQLRLEFAGAIWHVTSRGNERRDIIRDDHDCHRFLEILARVVAERRWLLHAWVLMPNHYHVLIETPEIGLSRGVKALNEEYALWFNKRHERVGHLFQGRFKGILVERETHLFELVRYIVLNPVRAGIVRYAGDYKWSNYRATAGLRPAPQWLETDWTLQQFAGGPIDVHEAYRRFVASGRGAWYKPWESLIGQIYLGGAQFRERMQERVMLKERSTEHPRPQREWFRPDIDSVRSLVRGEFGGFEKSEGHARKALAQLAFADAGLTFHAIGIALGTSDNAASKLRRAGLALYASNRIYREAIDRIRTRYR